MTALTISACAKTEDEPIRAYSVPKPEDVYRDNHVVSSHAEQSRSSVHAGRVKSRMLGAILLEGNSTWFFKLTGPDSDLQGAAETFADFIKSVRFSNGKPKWTLPRNWKQLPADDPRNTARGFPRYATILVGDAKDASELTVTRLGGVPPTMSADDWILVNVNRWRGQLGLPPKKSTQTLYTAPSDRGKVENSPDEVRKLTLNGRTVVLVQFVGSPGQQRGGPFMMR